VAWIDQYRKGGGSFGAAETFSEVFDDGTMTDEELDDLFEDYLAEKDLG
jgi:hypothetical protein